LQFSLVTLPNPPQRGISDVLFEIGKDSNVLCVSFAVFKKKYYFLFFYFKVFFLCFEITFKTNYFNPIAANQNWIKQLRGECKVVNSVSFRPE